MDYITWYVTAELVSDWNVILYCKSTKSIYKKKDVIRLQLCLKQSASKYNFVLLFCTKKTSCFIWSFAMMDCLTSNCIFVFIPLWKRYNCKRLANAWTGCGGLTLASHQNCSIASPFSGKGKNTMNDSCIKIRTGRSLSGYGHIQSDVVWGNYFNLLPIKSEIMRNKNKS